MTLLCDNCFNTGATVTSEKLDEEWCTEFECLCGAWINNRNKSVDRKYKKWMKTVWIDTDGNFYKL